MASSFSLCSSSITVKPAKATLIHHNNKQLTAASTTTFSKNVNFLSHSLSSLRLTKQQPSSFVTKLSETEAVLADPPIEVESQAVVPEQAKRQEIFAVVMIGSRQYIVFPGRYIYTQRLKDANVNDKIILNKVLLVGTKTSTYIGKPIVPNTVVHAVVEEQLLDKKVIVFKYKKKKNYRRNIGHRQPITRIRITGITGFEGTPVVTLDDIQ